MNAARDTSTLRRWPEALRWGACFALALCFHAAGAAALLARWSEDSDLVANAPVIMIELAPLPVAPDITPTELPPGPQQSRGRSRSPSRQKPVEKVELPPEPQAEPQLAVMPPPKPIEKPEEKSRSKSTPACQRAQHGRAAEPSARRRRCRAPPRAIPTRCRTGNRSWSPGSNATSAIRRKRSRAASTAWRNSPSASTAAAACTTRASCAARARACSTATTLALVERAQPLPPPPPEIGGAQIAIVVPIRYNMR